MPDDEQTGRDHEGRRGHRRGGVQVVKLPNAVAVVADRYFRAQSALNALKIEWEVGAAGATNSPQLVTYTLTVTNIPDPLAVSATAAGTDSVALAWSEPSGRSVLIVRRLSVESGFGSFGAFLASHLWLTGFNDQLLE